MTDDTERALRKALGTVNDIEPPPDDLFVQRAVNRGRAKANRRRSTILGAAASVALVGVLGGGWVANQQHQSAQSTASGMGASEADTQGAPQAPALSAPGLPSAGASDTSVPDSGGGSGYGAGGVQSERDTNQWLTGASSPQRTAFDAIALTLAADYPDVFGGAYASDATNTHIVVTVTRPDPALEALVTGAMPAPGDVEFREVAHTSAEKLRLAAQIEADTALWRAKGVTLEKVEVDARTDRVVVTIAPAPGTTAGHALTTSLEIKRKYGIDLVTVVQAVAIPAPGGTLPGPPAPPRPPTR